MGENKKKDGQKVVQLYFQQLKEKLAYREPWRVQANVKNYFRCSFCILLKIIIKITISSLVIGLKKFYFSLIRLPSCYRTVCYWIACYWTVCYRTVQKANHIQICRLKQPITFKVVIRCTCACACFCVYAGNLRMFTPPLSVF